VHLAISERHGKVDMSQGFKQFMSRGNVLDLAVAVVMGAAFGAVVTALVKDIITPFIAAIIGRPDFSAIEFTVHGSKFPIGDFINAVISFVLIGAAVYFLIVLPVNRLLARMRRGEAAPDPFAIAIARSIDRLATSVTRFNILAPVTGTAVSRRGAELAIALAQASRGSLTALHVAQPRRPRPWGRRIGAAIAPMGSADAIIRDIVQLGDPYGVQVRGAVRDVWPPADAILQQLQAGGHNLLVLGVSPRPGEQLSFGQIAAELLERAECSILFVASEPFVAAPEKADAAIGLARPRARSATLKFDSRP
jgi:large conductance mechanosensitive channel